ncbi:MAG: PDZ domain-containing protein [Phycisphaerales bacterium]|nr:PDZ domain-containing protein [Phycisphaerales bacterium]
MNTRNVSRARRVQTGATALLTLLAFATATHADELKRRGMLGIQLAPIFENQVAELKLKDTKGIFIRGVMPNSAAERSGMLANDVIVSVGGKSFDDIDAAVALFRDYRAGDVMKLGVVRDGQPVDLELTLEERPKETSDEFDIVYDSAGAPGHRVRTYVTKPRDAAKHPAILFIQSLNPGPMEFANERNANHPYKQLVDNLTREGFVTMRVDRPGNGDSEGDDPRRPKLADDLTAFGAALEKLASYDFVDPQRVYIFAQSTGSVLAPTLARSSAARGVITYAAIARAWNEHLLESMQARWKLELLPEDEYKTNSQQAAELVKLCMIEGQNPKSVLEAHPELRGIAEGLVQDEFIMGSHYSFFHEMATVDLPKQWAQVDVPVLAMWGTCDFVAGRGCSELIAQSVNSKHPGRATFKALEGIDHGYSPMEDAEESYLAGFTGEFDADIIKAVKNWVSAQKPDATS